MILRIDRRYKKEGYTISRVYIDGKRFGCHCLEDKDRGLHQGMSLEKIKAIKVKGDTAIPSGSYDVTITYSPKFKKNLPLVNDVPGYSGIRIHSGNDARDTSGCLLFGINDKVGRVSNSRYWTNLIISKISLALKRKEKVTLTID